MPSSKRDEWSTRIIQFRQQYGITQVALGAEIGVSWRAIQGYEYREYYPSSKVRRAFERLEARYERGEVER